MHITNIISVLGLVSTVAASPMSLNALNLFSRQDGKCDPQNMKLDEKDTSCEKKKVVKDGHCPGIPQSPGNAGCMSYCEESVSKGYGQEVPFQHGYCQGGTTCNVGESKSVTTTQTWTVNIGSGLGTGESVSKALTGAFDIGASYSWSKSLTYTTSTLHAKELPKGSCGYWTFIPYAMTSCGTLTQSGQKSMAAGYYGSNRYTYCTPKDGLTDVKDWCNTSLFKAEDGKVDGEVVFVYVNCNGGGIMQNKDITDPNGSQPESIFYKGVSTGPI